MDNMCDFCNNLQLVMLGDKWQWVGTKGYLPTPDPQYITGADGKWYDTDRNGYAPEDIPSNKAMTYTAVAPKTAFAVYSADDQSLNFYKRSGVPAAGEQFNGKTATAVYTGIETDTYIGSWQSNVPQNPASYLDTSPWAAYKSTIKTITAVDKIQPKSLDFWFSNPKSWATATAVTSADLSNIDTSKITSMSNLFTGCSNLTSLNISNWNVSNVTNMTNMFSVYSGMFRTQPACSSLTTLDLSNWDTSNVTSMDRMFYGCSRLNVDCSNWDVGSQKYSSSFNYGAPGVVLPLAWQTSSDEGDKDSTIAPLCEEQENRDALSVSDENSNDEAVSKTDGEASADSEAGSSNTASADDAGAKEEASDDIVQEELAAA